MAVFLFWNIKRKNIDSLIQNLVREHKVDILILAEYYPSSSNSALSTILMNDGLVKRNTSERFGVFARPAYGMSCIPVNSLGDRVELWNWYPTPSQTARFAIVHGLDRVRNDDSTRRVFFRRIAEIIRNEETNSHRRSIVFGDFNASPFESSILSSDGLHALGVRHVQNAPRRLVRWGDEREDFFYNPMWRAFGHVSSDAAGMATYYWQNNQANELFWHMIDQVVIRPEESSDFPEDKLKILSQVGNVNLLAPDNTPDKQLASDHLPFIFHWNV